MTSSACWSDVFGTVQPVVSFFAQAEELGCEMAKDDRVLTPDLCHAQCYEDLGRFQNAHREQLERTDEFTQVWQERLFAMAEEEAKPWGLRMDDSMASWDVWYHEIVVPLKNLMWEAWEDRWNLPALYATASHTTEVAEVIPSGRFQAVYRYLSLLSQFKASPVAEEEEIEAPLWQ